MAKANGHQVPKSWSVLFTLSISPDHVATLYGYSSEEEVQPVILYLENKADVVKLAYQVTWKEGIRSPWMQEKHVIR